MKISQENFKRFEPYALVTGAASGMGKLYCEKLAAMGYNLIMVDIKEGNLLTTAGEIKAQVTALEDFRADSKANFKLKTVVQDLSALEAAQNLAHEAEGCEVEVLVNNAGIMYFQPICTTTRKTLSLITLLHTYTPLMLCREFVPAMIARGGGYVLNVSSLGGWMIWPGIGMYGSTKRFIRNFSRELRIECSKTGVSVTNAYFGAVNTELIPLKPNLRKLACNLRVMIPAEFATDKALEATFKRRRGTMPGFLNKIFFPLCVIVPDWLLAWAFRKFGKYLFMNV